MSEFVTIKQASEITGKHADTIRAVIRKHKGSKEVTKDSKGRLLVSVELLKLTYPDLEGGQEASQEGTEGQGEQQSVNNPTQATEAPQTGLGAVINALTSQLEAKDKQIDNLQQIIKEKEDNTTKLQDQFQQLLGRQQLLEGTNEPVEKPTGLTTEQVKKSKATPKRTQATKPKAKKPTTRKQKPKKRGWFRRK